MRRTYWLLLSAALLLPGAAAHAHDVKDPVCRMTVDSDTAKWTHKLGNKSFYFCSKPCETRFSKSPEKYEKLAAQLERQELHTYTVDFKTEEPAVAGKPVAMEFAIRYAKTGALVTEFEVVHERLLHLLMTTTDLAWFEHQHPVRGADGRFRLTWTFPRPGSYRLYADFTPADGDNQVKPVTLTVGGGAAKTVVLRPDRARVKQIGDLHFTLQLQGGPPRMETPMLLTYTVRDRHGRLVREIQPFIGAPGHLIAISRNGKEVVHTHSLQAATGNSMSGEREPFQVTPDMVSEAGPRFSFKLTTPTGGLYRTWAQFMYRNRVYTVPFTFQVADLWAKTPAPAAKKAPAAPKGNGVQRATIVIDGGYQPATLSVTAGRPVELIFVRKENAGCGEVVHFPSLGLKRNLAAGGKTVVTFTPRKAGTVPFTCGMAMYRGQVKVR